MKIICFPALAFAIVLNVSSAPFAHSIVSYEPGAGYASGYDNPLAALGEPSRITPGMFGGAVDPFNPPYLPEQVVSIGAGGRLTVSFEPPLENDPLHPFGLDFNVFGNNGFTITNGDFSGGGITDGSTFTFDPPGASQVWVSEDGLTFYELVPPEGIQVTVDGYYPTDGAGNFEVPVNVALRDFGGLGLEGIRELYGGSAGGTGFDLAWARDAQGADAKVCQARYLRVEVSTGKVEIDGFASVAAPVESAVAEDFSCDPMSRGWGRHGASELFLWKEEEQELEVTWDSSRTNSFFYKPLGQVLSKADDFSLAFDLKLNDITIGTTPDKPYTFQIALGLLNWSEATREDFFRGSGIHPQWGSRSLFEFDYFPDSGFGATVAPTVVSTNNQIAFKGNFPLEMTAGDLFHVKMIYSASDQVLRTVMTRNGEPFGLPPNQMLLDLALDGLADFHADTVAVASYSDGGQTPPEYAGSILAHGVVDNIRVEMPPIPVRQLAGGFFEGAWQLNFQSRAGYYYQLERSVDFVSWENAADPIAGTGEKLVLEDELSLGDYYFYRVRAFKP